MEDSGNANISGHNQRNGKTELNIKKKLRASAAKQKCKMKRKVKTITAENKYQCMEQLEIVELQTNRYIVEDGKRNGKNADSGNEQELEAENAEESTGITALSKSNKRIIKKSHVSDIELNDNHQKSKAKLKSKLSLNSGIKTKNKFKENSSNQGTIMTFFQKMSPKAEQHIKNLHAVENSYASNTGSQSNCVEEESKSHKESCLIQENVNEAENFNFNGLDEEYFSSVCITNRKENVCDKSIEFMENNNARNKSHVSDSNLSSKNSRRKKKLLKLAKGECKSSKRDRKKKNSKETLSHKEETNAKEEMMLSESNENEEVHKKDITNLSNIEKLTGSNNLDDNMQQECENNDENQKQNSEGKEFKKVRFSDQLEEISPEPVRQNSKSYAVGRVKRELISENKKQSVGDEENTNDVFEITAEVVKENCGNKDAPKITVDVDSSTSLEENADISSSESKISNAFTFMMDSRHKSIGQNLEGKELEKSEEALELSKESKKKLSARKAVFEKWANTRGAKKRKLEDEEKGMIIENKLKKRAKRLKKMLTEKQPEETLILDESEDKSEIVAKKNKANRIFESDSECTRDCLEVACPELKELNDEAKTVPEKASNKKEKCKRKLKTEEKIPKQENVVASVVDDALDDEMFTKNKKPRLSVFSDSSSNESDTISEAVLTTGSKKSASGAALQQTELSSFFGTLNKSRKTGTANKNSKLQMNRNINSSEKTQHSKRTKNRLKSKLTLNKNEDSSNTAVSDDFSTSIVEIENHDSTESETTKIEQKEIEVVDTDLDNETRNSDFAENVLKTEIQAVFTPRTTTRWKMRLRVSLAGADDEKVEKLVQPHNDMEAAKSKDDLEHLQKPKRKTKKLMESSDTDSDDEPSSFKKFNKEKLEKDKSLNAKPVKLAPLFIRVKPKPKPSKLDETTIEARRKFLHSGVPDSLKKAIEKQQRVEEIEYQIFPTVSHVTVKPTSEQLRNENINFWALPKVDFNFTNCKPLVPEIGSLNLGSVTSSVAVNNTEVESHVLQKITNVKDLVKQIKAENQNYPVYKVFRFLLQKHVKNVSDEQKINGTTDSKTGTKKPKNGKSKKKSKTASDDDVPIVGDPPKQQLTNISNQEIWTDLYRPSTSEEIFGNHVSIAQFKTWLKTWLEFSEEINMQRSRRKRRSSDSSDFESTDADSKDSSGLPGNTVILCGPHGSGKTTAVYALCTELGINVLELNASSKRTGKRLFQELQEATQSHQVRKNDANCLNSFLRREDTKTPSQSSRNSDSQSSTLSKKMCLLLIEDVDIVFEQDENFIPALGQLLVTSKRPVVLTTTDPNCLHLKKFLAQHLVITFCALSAKILGTWLQILCLIEGLHVDRQAVVELLERNKGDARSTLLQLQFWAQSGGQSKIPKQTLTSPLSTDLLRFSCEENLCKDDSSNISWLNEEEATLKQESTSKNIIHSNCLESFGYFKKHNNFFMSLPLDLGNIWWGLSDLLNISPPRTRKTGTANVVKNEKAEENVVEEKSMQSDLNSQPSLTKNTLSVNNTDSKNLQEALNIFETLAMTDSLYKKLCVDCDYEPVHKNRDDRVKNSTELNESMESYSSSRDLAYDWSNVLLDGYLNCYNVDERTVNRNCSVTEEKRWRTKQNKCKAALSAAIPLICHLDRDSVNTDYLSTLRTIARSEVIRASNNNKRRNRFYNYLRGIGISCNDSLFETACGAFQHEK